LATIKSPFLTHQDSLLTHQTSQSACDSETPGQPRTITRYPRTMVTMVNKRPASPSTPPPNPNRPARPLSRRREPRRPPPSPVPAKHGPLQRRIKLFDTFVEVAAIKWDEVAAIKWDEVAAKVRSPSSSSSVLVREADVMGFRWEMGSRRRCVGSSGRGRRRSGRCSARTKRYTTQQAAGDPGVGFKGTEEGMDAWYRAWGIILTFSLHVNRYVFPGIFLNSSASSQSA